MTHSDDNGVRKPHYRRKSHQHGLFAPCRSLEWHAPFKWLGQGWQDFRQASQISVTYGLFFAVSGLVLSVVVAFFHSTIFVFSLAGLFLLLGPLLAFGLYDIPRQLERGETPTLAHSITQIRSSAANQWIFAVVLVVIALMWMRAASIIYVFYPEGEEPTLESLVNFFAIGIGAGAFFSGLVFGISAFSLPMMMDRNADAISASLTSLSAVVNNLFVSTLWALMIVLLVAFGFATACLGFVVVLPLIGFATWHGYQDAIMD